MAELRRLKQQRHDAENAISEHVYRLKVGTLMKKPILRNKAPEWLWAACQRLLTPDASGVNIIQKGWNELYLDKARSPEVVRQATEEREAQEAAATAEYVRSFACV